MTVLQPLRDWIGRSLRRKLGLLLMVTLVAVSVVMLVLLVGYYQRRLQDQRADAGSRLTDLFHVALENAMLKRDLDGLRRMVTRLGEQEGVLRVFILDRKGEVRFASDETLLGRVHDRDADPGCRECHAGDPERRSTVLYREPGGGAEILRSVLPVPNREICSGCHGPPALHPINGVLVVDREAGTVRREALTSALLLGGAGAIVVLLALGCLAVGLDRTVLRPVRRLTRAAERLAAKDLDVRTALDGADEIGRLGRAFDRMAEHLAEGYRQLERRERFTRALMEAMPDGVRVVTPDFRVVATNRRYAEMHGLTEAEARNRPCYAAHGRSEPCPPTLVTCPLQELRTDGARVCVLHRHVRGDGRTFPVEINAVRVDLPFGDETHGCVIESVRDREEEARLDHEQRLSEIGQLATGVAHEIRNPLASIEIALRALGAPGVDSATREEYLRLMEDEIGKCIEVTDRLLRLALPPGSERQLVRLSQLVEEVLSLLRYEAMQQGIRTEIDIEPGAEVLGHDSELRMLVLNLAQNAFHAMPEGRLLRVRGRLTGGRVELLFEDTGVGIPPDDLPRIYLPFWSRRADRRPGTGLGLWIVRGVVEKHGGRIRVDSEPGKGTCFLVDLPSAEGELDSWERSHRTSLSY